MRYRKRRRRKPSGRRTQWECEDVKRQFNPIESTEMRQRLAECLEILLSSKSQLNQEIAFSSDLTSSRNTKARSNQKRKARL